MTAAAALADAVRRLKVANVPDAATDARVLLAHAMGIERSRLTLVMPDALTEQAQARFAKAIAARETRQPVSHITGIREFYGRVFTVTPDVLDPRPDTELLVDAALQTPFETVLDLGTGSGCILLSLLAENTAATGQGMDCSHDAIDVANVNATALRLEKRSQFAVSDWFANVQGRFDLIVSNPPYITGDEMADLAPEVRDWEPKVALTPGGDGLEAYRIITAAAPRYLTPNGRLIVEIGAGQAKDVQALFQSAGFDGITCLQDLNGRDRVVLGHIP